MKNLIFLLLAGLIVLFTGCGKDDTSDPGFSGSKLTITDFQITGASVSIKWDIETDLDVNRFYVIRRNFKTADTTSLSPNDIIEYIYNGSADSFIDESVPSVSYLEYQVVAEGVDNRTYSTVRIFSNVKALDRPEYKRFRLNPMDVLQDAANHRMYILDGDSGKISILDYHAREITKQIYTYATLDFSSLGTFNGMQELYVPRNDGWIFIYDANTLEQKDQIRTEVRCHSVVYNEGKIFAVISLDDFNYSLKVIDRATKTVVQDVMMSMRPEHIALVQGSNTRLFGLSSSWIFSFDYNPSGNSLTWINTSFNSSYYTYRALEAFPNGQGFIASATGSIFASTLGFVQTLPYGENQYSSFAFNDPFTSVFAGCSNYKHVIEYSVPGYSEKHIYPCLGYPSATFTDGSDLIVLSKVNSSYLSDTYADDYFLERIAVE